MYHGYYYGFDTTYLLLVVPALLIALIAVGNALDDVFVNGAALVLRNNNGVVGVPLADHVALLDFGAVRHEERRAVRQVVRIKNDFGLGIDDADDPD